MEKGEMNVIKIAIYGKGGIGKSTTTSNLSAAFSSMGYRVLQIGCDPKADSTKNLAGYKIPSVLDQLRNKANDVTKEDIVFSGYGKTFCVEAGGPTPGIGCAGRGIITAFEKMEGTVVDGYTKVEDAFVDRYLTKEGETVAQAKERLTREQP